MREVFSKLCIKEKGNILLHIEEVSWIGFICEGKLPLLSEVGFESSRSEA